MIQPGSLVPGPILLVTILFCFWTMFRYFEIFFCFAPWGQDFLSSNTRIYCSAFRHIALIHFCRNVSCLPVKDCLPHSCTAAFGIALSPSSHCTACLAAETPVLLPSSCGLVINPHYVKNCLLERAPNSPPYM